MALSPLFTSLQGQHWVMGLLHEEGQGMEWALEKAQFLILQTQDWGPHVRSGGSSAPGQVAWEEGTWSRREGRSSQMEVSGREVRIEKEGPTRAVFRCPMAI